MKKSKLRLFALLITSSLVTSSLVCLPESQKTVTLGTTLPLSRGLEALGGGISIGAGLAFAKSNQHRGASGHVIKLLEYDNQHRDYLVQKNLSRIFKKTSILFCPYGLDSIPSSKNSLVLFPEGLAPSLQSSNHPSIVCYRPSLEKEIEALVNYTANDLGAKNIGVFFEDSLWGQEGVEAVKNAVKQLGGINAVFVGSAAHTKNTTQVKSAVKKFKDKEAKLSPDAIICIAHHRAAYDFIGEMINAGFAKCKFLATAECSLIQDDLMDSRGVDLITSSPVPSPWKSPLPIVKQYRSDMRRYRKGYPLSLFTLEGYVAASIFVDCLKNIKTPITNQNIVNYFSSIKGKKLDGLELNWDPATRTLSKSIWINTGRDIEWKKYV